MPVPSEAEGSKDLVSCGACGGLSPATASECLHCDAAIGPRSTLRRLISIVSGGAFMMTLAACYGVAYRGGPQYAQGTDNDRDGSPVPADCADDDPDRWPGNADPDLDGIDQNCDGVDGWRDPAVLAEPQSDKPAP
jgi:hypothetical protein